MATYELSGTVSLGIWAKKGGSWQKVTTIDVNIYNTYTSGGNKTVSWDTGNQTVNLGSGVEAVGITGDATYPGASGATLQAFSHLIFSVPAASSNNRSATPQNQKVPITVRPNP